VTLRRRVRWDGMGWDGDELTTKKRERERGLLAETGECTYIVSNVMK